MIVKAIYRNRIEELKKEFNIHKEFVISNESRIIEYQDLLDTLQAEVAELNNDQNLDVNIKYIKINEKLKLVSEITDDYTKFYNSILDKRDKMINEFNLLVKNIAVENKLSVSEINKAISLY